MGKIVRLGKLKKLLKPGECTLVGGAFDLFHTGHLRFLRAASKQGRPLVVIVQTDKMVRIRKGFSRPIVSENHRAEIISALEFVDYVLILDRATHYDRYIEAIRPRNIVFFKENMHYRMRRAKEIERKFPKTKVIFISKKGFGRKVMNTSKIIKKICNPPIRKKVGDVIVDQLYELSEKSPSKVGKISAILTNGKKIVKIGGNTKSERHAEMQILSKKIKGANLADCCLYVLIPPCIQCSEKIVKTRLKTVYYLHAYGNDDGIALLRKSGIKVSKYHWG